MIKLYNYIIYIISDYLTKIFKIKEVGIYNFLIRLSLGNFKYSKYGVMLINQNLKENTYKFCLGGAYGNEYSNYLSSYNKQFIFLDVGSNIGLYSCIASKNLFCKNVYAFEPIKFICNIARANFQLNSVKGKIYKFGISSKNKIEKFYFNPNHTGLSSLIKKKIKIIQKY